MRYGSVCSGIEAATVAWEPLGWEPAFFAETAKFPRAVLKHHYPNVPLHGDFTTIKAGEYRPIDLLVGGTPCFPAGTMIATENGFLEIEKVAVGDKVLTHTGHFRTVRRTGHKISETVRATGQGHFGLVTTTNHPFLARQKHIKSTRVNGRSASIRSTSDEEWVPASQLAGKHWACVADWPASVCPPIEHHGHENSIPEISTALFRLAGAYLGDGWAAIDGRHGYTKFGITKAKLDKLKATFNAIGTWSSTEDRTTIRVQFSSRPLARWLIEKFGSGAAAKSVPMWALGMPLEYRQALIEGYLITDGGRAGAVGMRATTISKQLALTMRALAVSCGYASSVGFSERPPECEIQGRTVHQANTYTVSFSPSARTSFYEKGFRWQLVRKVEPTGISQTVYDLEVAEDHSYVADGIVVHNCQSFSIAGLHGGLDDERGNLALEFLRLAGRLRPRWILWENVPGVLSSNGGRDFGSFLGGLGDLGYGFAYRCLDAQYFGLAQRRLRVFVVGYFGDWRRAAAVLFEPQSLRWDTPPRRQSRQDVAPTISARTRSGGGLGTDFDLDGGLIADPVSPPLKTNPYGDHESREALLIAAIQERAASENPQTGPDGVGVRTDGLAYTLEARNNVQAVAFGGINTNGATDISAALTAKPGSRQDFESETFITHALRADGFDASEDGTGRGTPIVAVPLSHKNQGADAGGQVAVAFDWQSSAGGSNSTETFMTSCDRRAPAVSVAPHGDGAGSTAKSNGEMPNAAGPMSAGGGTPAEPVAFSCKDHGADAGDVAPTLRAMGFNKSHANAGGQVAVAFAQNTRDEVREMPIAGALASQPGMKQQSYVMLPEAAAVALRGREGGATAELGGDISHAIRASTGGSDKAHILTHAVRRLTPRECERLQGFPDDYTRIPVRRYAVKRITKLRPADMWEPAPDGGWYLMAADGPRYMVLGNSMAVPVMRRIGERIAMMEAIIDGETWASKG